MILSQSLARKLLPGENPLGQRVTLSNSGTYTIVGVAADVRNSGLAGAPDPEFYLDRDQFPDFWLRGITSNHFAIAIRSPLAPAIHRILAARRNPRAGTLRPRGRDDHAGPRPRLRPPATFSCHIVQPVRGHHAAPGRQRALRIGPIPGGPPHPGDRRSYRPGRIARRIAAMVVRSALRFTLAGAALGIAGALLVSRWIESLLFETPARDPATIAIVAALLVACAIAAALAPSLSAARTDPMAALRAD